MWLIIYASSYIFQNDTFLWSSPFVNVKPGKLRLCNPAQLDQLLYRPFCTLFRRLSLLILLQWSLGVGTVGRCEEVNTKAHLLGVYFMWQWPDLEKPERAGGERRSALEWNRTPMAKLCLKGKREIIFSSAATHRMENGGERKTL